MGSNVFTFNFDTQCIRDLRVAVNEKLNLSIDKTHNIYIKDKKKTVNYYAWDRICTIMSRVEDTIDYINMLELGNCRSEREAFDFYEFINNAYIVVEGIKIIGQIFAIDEQKIKAIENSQAAFGDVLNAGGTDDEFFRYIRSLCAVHPFSTTRHKTYMKSSPLHCCPYVVWSGELSKNLFDESRDLSARIYTSEQEENSYSIPLKVSQFESYINSWIGLIPDIIEAIHRYNHAIYDEFKKMPLKQEQDFNDEVEYILYLKDEYRRRFGDYLNGEFDKIALILGMNVSNQYNSLKLDKYKNAIRYSISFLRKSLETMELAGYEQTGIHDGAEGETSLFLELESPSARTKEMSLFHYNLSKLYYLEKEEYNVFDKIYARELLDEMKGFINRYVNFTNQEPDREKVVLVNLVLYLHALENKSELNRNIPNELRYRERLLTEEESLALNKKQKVGEEKMKTIVLEDFDGKTIEINVIVEMGDE